MNRILEIDRCDDCKFLQVLENRDRNIQGYCTFPPNKDLEEVKKISINPGYIGARHRIYPFIHILSIDTIRIPEWCKLPVVKGD